ncbi:MAG: type II toxin-antitoxin system death-on-curing family toxin [Desulfovibrionales bacterium]
MSRDFLTPADIQALHDLLVSRYGGMTGVRDFGALESAAFRPQSGFYSTVTEEAAALMESIAKNHPFIDGNKRTAFAATDVFLRINGYRMHLSSTQALADILNLFDQNRFEFQFLNAWLEEVVRPEAK